MAVPGHRTKQFTNTDTTWMKNGNCRGPDTEPQIMAEIMFPKREADIPLAKAVCRGCPVEDPCLNYAVENRIESDGGVWGGMSDQERYRMRRNRMRQIAKAARTA